ncbi:cytospin-B-like isoform X3 [Populus alba x Populus x berolinensis]|uniref:Cytospin-B-like isoform X3 n=1 Tax=Populus alba x Populus x berolinensis TaxID=444605 RepID=A0AAD6PYQ9_9ROSI|nr:cytospin-B-like isoform X3 [Populus alba x Populus x berolinensis]
MREGIVGRRRERSVKDQMSVCRSFGSNYHPSSQSRKISIGILIDSLPKKRSGGTKEDEAAVPNIERVNSKKESSVESKKRGKGAIDATTKGKQTEAPGRVPSPWTTTRSFHQKLPISEGVHAVGTSSLPRSTGRGNRISTAKNVPVKHSVEFFAKHTSNSHSGDGKKKFGGFTYKRKGGEDRNSQPGEEFTFATAQEGSILDKVATNDKTEERTETLKMKLWEILGNVSSQKIQPSNSQVHQIGANNLNPEQILNQADDVVVKPRQSPDTIETDSESPNHTMKRPVTRSLTRKRASTKQKPEKNKVGPSSSYRQKLQEKNVFSFEERLPGKQNVAVNGGSSMKKGQIKSCGIETCKTHVSEDYNADKIQEGIHKSEKSRPAEKTSSLSNKKGNIHCSLQNKRECREPKNGNKERDSNQSAREASFSAEKTFSLSNKMGNFHGSPRNRRVELKNRNQERYSHQSGREDSHQSPWTHMTDQQKDFNSPAAPEHGDQQENFDTPSSNSTVNPQDDFQSPTFKINSPTLSSFPSSMPKSDQRKQVFASPEQAMRSFTVGKIHSFWTPRIQMQDIAAELTDSPPNKTLPVKGKRDVDGGLSESSPECGYSESSEDGRREEENCSTETATAEKSKFMLHPTKRFCNNKGEKVRVILLFVMALENFRKKMKLETGKKSSDILKSVSEKMHLELQNIESQIQTDLCNLNKNS